MRQAGRWATAAAGWLLLHAACVWADTAPAAKPLTADELQMLVGARADVVLRSDERLYQARIVSLRVHESRPAVKTLDLAVGDRIGTPRRMVVGARAVKVLAVPERGLVLSYDEAADSLIPVDELGQFEPPAAAPTSGVLVAELTFWANRLPEFKADTPPDEFGDGQYLLVQRGGQPEFAALSQLRDEAPSALGPHFGLEHTEQMLPVDKPPAVLSQARLHLAGGAERTVLDVEMPTPGFLRAREGENYFVFRPGDVERLVAYSPQGLPDRSLEFRAADKRYYSYRLHGYELRDAPLTDVGPPSVIQIKSLSGQVYSQPVHLTYVFSDGRVAFRGLREQRGQWKPNPRPLLCAAGLVERILLVDSAFQYDAARRAFVHVPRSGTPVTEAALARLPAEQILLYDAYAARFFKKPAAAKGPAWNDLKLDEKLQLHRYVTRAESLGRGVSGPGVAPQLRGGSDGD